MSNLLEQASLVMIPSGYKEDVVYSEIPLDGSGDLQMTRASNGTRVNSAGLVEDVPWNLLTYSEEFTNAAWAKGFSSITANATIAPNGTTTADKLVENNTTNQHFAQQVATVYSSNIYTITVYAKASERSRVNLLIAQSTSPFTNFANITYDLLAGTVSDTTFGTGSITSVGNGWFRCVATGTATASTGVIARVSLALTNNSDNYLGDGTSGAFIWGAQLNIGSTAKPYFPTTDRLNVPRLTYQNGGGGCPSLLLEPQRTNLLANQLSYNASTGVAYNTSVTDSPIIGINSARITKNEASGTVRYANQNCANSVLTGSTTYTISAYFKYDGYDFQTSMEYNNSTNFGGTSWAQPINIASTGITLGTSSQCTGNIQNVGNGWYRVSVTITTGASPVGSTVTYLMRLPSTLSTGQGFLQALPQFEQGAYSTTVIPTSGATATRVADSFSRSNIYTNGLITSSGGTWFVELRNNVLLVAENAPSGFWLGTSSGTPTSDGTIYFRQGGGTQRTNVWKYVSGTATPLYATTTDTTKIAIKWNGTTADIFENGTKVVSGTAFTATNMEFLTSTGVGRPFFIQQMALFPTPLSDAECQALTTI